MSTVQELKVQVKRNEERKKKISNQIKKIFNNMSSVMQIDKQICQTHQQIAFLALKCLKGCTPTTFKEFSTLEKLPQSRKNQILKDFQLRDYLQELRQSNELNHVYIENFRSKCSSDKFYEEWTQQFAQNLKQEAKTLQIKNNSFKEFQKSCIISPKVHTESSEVNTRRILKSFARTPSVIPANKSKLDRQILVFKTEQSSNKPTNHCMFSKEKEYRAPKEIYYDLKRALEIGNRRERPVRKAIDHSKATESQLPSIHKKYQNNFSSVQLCHNLNSSNTTVGRDSNSKLKQAIEQLQRDTMEHNVVKSLKSEAYNYLNLNLKNLNQNRKKYDLKKLHLGEQPSYQKLPKELLSLKQTANLTPKQQSVQEQSIHFHHESLIDSEENSSRSPNCQSYKRLVKARLIEKLKQKMGIHNTVSYLSESYDATNPSDSKRNIVELQLEATDENQMKWQRLNKHPKVTFLNPELTEQSKRTAQASNKGSGKSDDKYAKLKKEKNLRKKALTSKQMSLLNKKTESSIKGEIFSLPQCLTKSKILKIGQT